MNLQNEKAVIQIINDSIIFYRIVEQMEGAMKAFNPSNKVDYFTPAVEYNGFETAMDLIGLEDNKYGHLRDYLSEIGYEHTDKEQPADEIARELYFKWISVAQERIELNCLHLPN